MESRTKGAETRSPLLGQSSSVTTHAPMCEEAGDEGCRDADPLLAPLDRRKAEAIVSLLYEELLLRPAESAGLAGKALALMHGRRLRDIIRGIVNSPEFRQKHAIRAAMHVDRISSCRAAKEKLIFIHIPKTGGTTLHYILVQNYKADEICPERFNKLNYYDRQAISTFLFYSGHFDVGQLQNIDPPYKRITLLREPRSRILSLYYFWRAHKWSIIERNQLDGPRVAKSLDLLRFLRCRTAAIPGNIDNIQTRTLLGPIFVGHDGGYRHMGAAIDKSEALARACEQIDAFDFVGLTEEFDESLRRLCALLGVERPAHVPRARDHRNAEADPNLEKIEREIVTPEIEAELDRLTELDAPLYAYARRKFSEVAGRADERPGAGIGTA
jgi:hypothetical protein